MTTTQLVDLAGERHLAGEIAQARQLAEQALADEPAHPGAHLRLGLIDLQEGRAASALAHFDRAIAGAPGAARYQFGRGQALMALGRPAEAAGAFARLLAVEPQLADVHYALGGARQAEGDLAGAAAAYRAALENRPDFADALNGLGNCLRRTGRTAEAAAVYAQALAAQPDSPDALCNLGSLLPTLGRADEAIELLTRAVRLAPGVPAYALNLGIVLCAQRRFDEASAALERALALDPNSPEAAYNLGNARLGLGRPDEAIARYLQAIAQRPAYADAYANLGLAYRERGENRAAIVACEAATRIDPTCAAAFNTAAGICRRMGQLDDACAVLRQSLEAQPDQAATHNNLGTILRDCGDLNEALSHFRRALALDPADPIAHSNLTYALSFASVDGQDVLAEGRRWDARHGAPLRPAVGGHPNERSSERRLRVGYVSGDFRNHCQSLFTLPLLTHHDRRAVQVFAYSSVELADEWTQRLAGLVDTWRPVRSLDDGELAELIRRDQIDVLVDLEMHMTHGRPQLFARKPAPVQVAWLAYPATTGIGAIDALFLDPRLAPPGCESEYSERVLRLPDTFWCYDPCAPDLAVNDLPATEPGAVTFGCLNAPAKITDDTLRLWTGVLRGAPHARLQIMVPEGGYRERLRARLAAAGIAAERVTFQPFQPRNDYLQTYREIDLGLDTFPYNGHTTSLDSLWMGVPVVSRVGRTAVGRAGLSQLFHLGLSEWAVETDEQYVALAVQWAHDLPKLAALRRDLRARMAASPLMDGRRFARAMEAAYRTLWREWCRAAT